MTSRTVTEYEHNMRERFLPFSERQRLRALASRAMSNAQSEGDLYGDRMLRELDRFEQLKSVKALETAAQTVRSIERNLDRTDPAQG